MKIIALILSSILVGGPVLANTSATQESFRFQVYYDQKPIGTHDFTVSHRDGKTRVRSRARFNYRFLMISLYEYSHDADEVWEGDCLIGLTATTTTNGLDQSVNLDKDELQARAGSACPASFAYWDLDRLRRNRLINSQTGEAVRATLQSARSQRIADALSDSYLLRASNMAPISLWYRQSDQRWVGLQTDLDGGRLVYRPR